jgi:Predicted glycosyltransferases
MRIFIIIVAYNFEPWIDRCLGSLRESLISVYPVVVDNCSSDNTVQIIEKNYPEVHLIKSSSNRGFGLGNNSGMAYAVSRNADYIFLLNQDAWIGKNTIERLLLAFEDHPDFSLLSPIHLDSTARYLDRGFSSYANLPMEVKVGQFDAYAGEVTQIDFINAAFWMFSINTLKTIGGFSPLFFYCGEDVDWINRLKYHQCKLGYVDSAYGCHDRENRRSTHDSSAAYHLSEYLNLNYSFGKAFMMAILAVVKKCFVSLLNGNFSKVAFYIKTLWNITIKTFAVLRERRRVKKRGMHYINGV